MRPFDVGQVDRLGGVGRFDRRVEQFEHALAAGEKVGEPGGELRERRQRRVEHGEVGEEGHQRTERHVAGEHIAAADVPDDQSAEAEDELHRRRERGRRVIDVHAAVAEVVADAVEAVVLAVFLGEGLHDANAGEHAGEHAGLLAAGIPVAVVLGVNALPEKPAADNDQRRRDEREDGELRVEREQHDADGGHLHDLQQEAAGDLLQQALDHFAVVGDAAGERADLMPVVVAEPESVQFFDQLGPEIERERDADARCQSALREVHDAEHDAGDGERRDDDDEAGEAGLGVGRPWPPLRMSSTRYCCSFGGVSSAATATSIRPHMMSGRPAVGPQHLAEPGEDRFARNAARAGFARRSAAAGRTSGSA